MTELSHLDQNADTTVREFFAALELGELDEAMELVTEDILWINVSLPTIHGERAVRRTMVLLERMKVRFAAHIHNIAQEGDVVLTERTDIFRLGPFEIRFWVCGTFELREGRIAVWRDHFSYTNVLWGGAKALVRALTPRARAAALA